MGGAEPFECGPLRVLAMAKKPSLKAITIKQIIVLSLIFSMVAITIIASNFRSLINEAMRDKGITVARSVEVGLTAQMLVGSFAHKEQLIRDASQATGIEGLRLHRAPALVSQFGHPEQPETQADAMVAEVVRTGSPSVVVPSVGDEHPRMRIVYPIVATDVGGVVCTSCHNVRYGEALAVLDFYVDMTSYLGMSLSYINILLVGFVIALTGITLFMLRVLDKTVNQPLGTLMDDVSVAAREHLDIDLDHFEASEFDRFASKINEFNHLILAQNRDLKFSEGKLKRLVDLGLSLSSEADMEVLLRKALDAGRMLSNADGATLYLRTKDDHLRFALRSKSDALPSTTIPLYDPATGEPDHHHVATHVALTGESILVDDVYQEARFDLSGTRQFDADTGYRTISMLTVPLKPRSGEVVGVLQLLNATDPDTGEVRPFDRNLVEFVEAMAAQAATALDNLRLVRAQERLFDSVTQVVASAIDAKSRYTGGHCERVPKIGRMLAEAACAEVGGPFADFKMNKEEWREFHLAAWLHDCGKVATPDYVVDKATKLETINNRIHEVRTRFEVLLRDRIITHREGLLAGGDSEVLDAQLAEAVSALHDDFAFVAECNVGGESLAPEKIERLRNIAARTWQRHFDDRLGLSQAELRRVKDVPKPALPVLETLLSDKPEHVIPRSESPLSYDAKALGIRLDIPEHLYNRGELYNLSIEYGTLTREERFKINEHAILTLIMLGQLPFPDSMKRVAEFAASHHETMIGTGYPRLLMREDMPVQARIMAIADIFEALTASDRPYKKAKKLSEALKIMNFMRKDRHIDGDLFELFLRRGVWADYAREHLQPEQLDEVDLEGLLNS